MSVRPLILALFVPLFLVLAGCGSKKTASAKLSGKVTLNGEPITGGTLNFHSDAGSYSASIDAEGNYRVSDLPAGPMIVTVDNEYLNPNKKTPEYKGGNSGPAAPKGAGPMAGKYGGMMSGPTAGAGAGPKNTGGEKSSPIPEGANTTPEGTYKKIPDIFKKKETSTVKVTIDSGDNVVNIEFTGK